MFTSKWSYLLLLAACLLALAIVKTAHPSPAAIRCMAIEGC